MHAAFHAVVCLLFLSVLGESSVAKFVDRKTPDWFLEKFSSSWMGKFPLAPMWWTIALLEFAVAGLMVASLVTLEFADEGAKPLMQYGMIGAVGVFSMLGFGLRTAQDFVGSANAFYYGSASAGLWFVVEMLGR